METEEININDVFDELKQKVLIKESFMPEFSFNGVKMFCGYRYLQSYEGEEINKIEFGINTDSELAGYQKWFTVKNPTPKKIDDLFERVIKYISKL